MKIILAAAVLSVCTVAQAASINKPAPAFTLKDINGADVSLADSKGKEIVFVNFWATWCPPCNQEFPQLSDLADEYKAKGVRVLAINIDKKRDVVDKFLAKLKSKPDAMKILLDPGSTVVAAYDIEAMPSSFIIDKKGDIRFSHLGYTEKDPQKWRGEINGLLSVGQSQR